MKSTIDRLSFWSGRDSADPFYVLCKFRNLFTGESADIVIDWNNHKAKAEFVSITEELIHDSKIAWEVATINVMWNELV